MQKIDPYNSKEYFENWKERKIEGISPKNAKTLRDYVLDMEKGVNTNGSVKGPRSPRKLLSIASRLRKIIELWEKKFKKKDILKATENQMHDLFLDMHSGKIVKDNGKIYLSVADYVKRFKAFWHWYMKRSRKEGIAVVDITEDLSAERKRKPPFVYFTHEDLNKMCKEAEYDTEVTMQVMYDLGIRSPTELQNLRVCDFSKDFKEVTIREETTKNKYGRTIKLKLCSEAIKKFIEDNELSGEDLIFTFNPATMNKRLKLLGKKVLGDKLTLGRKKGSELTMYDFRHSAGCFWIQRYKSEMSLMYRFAWKSRQMIDYYTELLGMKDLITDEDMLPAPERSQLEKEIETLKRQQELMKKVFDKVLEKENITIKTKDGKITIPKKK